MFDLGTGLRYFGRDVTQEAPFRGACLLTHLHWDHAQGLPFFTPILQAGAEFDIYGPAQDDGRPLADAVRAFISPPHFPVPIEALPGTFRFHELERDDIRLGEIDVKARLVPHVGNTLGYRVTAGGVSIAYVPDHQQPYDGSFSATDDVMELVEGVDLLIHDAQYTPEEFAQKRDWGHCTPEFAMWLAREAGVKKLALFHHDPVRDDDALDALEQCARAYAARSGFEAFAAAEGQSLLVRRS